MRVLSKTKLGLLILALAALIAIGYNRLPLFINKVPYTSDNILSLKKRIHLDRLPQHVAVMMDGNGRWAAKQGKPRVFGHMNSLQSVQETIEACLELQIPYLTLYAFSTENWERPKEEINTLMQLFLNTVREKLADLQKNNIRIRVIGDISRLPRDCQAELRKAIDATKNNSGLQLLVALSYSGRWDIMQAIRSLAKDLVADKINIQSINNEMFQQYLSTPNIPDPDVLIRTGGDMRISNFFLWQLAYTELIILDKYWPEFRKQDLYKAIITYQHRDRRFGRVKHEK